MRALITGITGFVGTHLAASLRNQGDEVLGVSRSAKWRTGLSEYPQLKTVDLLRWDIRQSLPSNADQRIREFRPDVIFHLAAISIPADCGLDEPTTDAYATNVDGTGRVVELADSLANRPSLMLASSCHVYGMPADRGDAVEETAPLRPENGYGHTKRAAEELVERAVANLGLNAWIVRGFQQTGPLQSDRMLLPEWSRQFAAREPVIHIRTLGTTLDLMDVRDAARVYALLARHSLRSTDLAGAALNVGTGVRRSGIEILDHLRHVAGYQPEIVESSPGQRRNPIARLGRLQALLPWTPEYSLGDTVRDTYRYWQGQLKSTS